MVVCRGTSEQFRAGETDPPRVMVGGHPALQTELGPQPDMGTTQGRGVPTPPSCLTHLVIPSRDAVQALVLLQKVY